MKVAVIGGGIVGLATARQVLKQYPSIRVVVLEKENGPGRHQTGNNSGVLHCGLYYKPGSLKARLAVSGVRKMVKFCEEHQVRYEQCGKVVVATDPEELPRLHQLLQRGQANGLSGLQLLSAEEIGQIEPHAAGLAAIRVPEEGIVDFVAAAHALAEDIIAHGGEIRYSSRVTHLRERGGWVIETDAGDHQADFLINCAGLHCDRISRMAGARDGTRIVPFRGEYFKLKPERAHLVRNLIYPVPDPQFPFLGVHFTRLIHGGIEAGPNAVLALGREAYRKTEFNVRDLVEAVTYRGFWRFMLRNRATCWEEFRRSMSKVMFWRSLQRLVPELQLSDLSTGGAGVRAQAVSPTGELVQDFCFVRQARALHVLNAPSPAATASLAIAEEIVKDVHPALVN